MPRLRSIPWHQRLEARVLASVILVAGVSLSAVLVATSRVVSQSSLDRSSRDLLAAREAFSRLVDTRAEFATKQTRLIAELPIFRASLTDRSVAADPATISVMAEDYCHKLEADFCVVSDPDGRVIGQAGAPRDQGPASALATLVAATRLGRPARDIIIQGEALVLVVSEPALFAQELLGTFTAGYLLDDRVARELALVTHCDVSFVCAGTHLCGTSLTARDRTALSALIEHEANVFREGDGAAPRAIGGASYVGGMYALPVPRTEDHGPGTATAARLLLLQDWSPTERALNQIQWALLLVGLLTFAVAVGATLVFSRRITRPLSNLATAAHEMAAGDWARRVPVDGPMEARAMAEAFNHMTAALRQREDQLRHAQKMEAIGRLAGGIAHDFNNLLTGILGYADLLLDELPVDHPMRPDVKGIQKAGRSAASLTRDLLAFSRKQVLQPVVLDINAIVTGAESLLRRLVGANIQLVIETAPNAQSVKVDPGQMEQVLLNLVTNARDAMPTGGCLTIATATVAFDGTELGPDVPAAGPHVVLTVRDTGHGMTDDVRSQIFEPFFTTKDIGKGTGLGLATVYGIVQQSGGRVWVDSAPGAGSTFNVSLPALEAAAVLPDLGAEPDPIDRRGSETILLVEDNESVRELTREALIRSGYRVIEARDGEEALRVASMHGEISLLLTDVVMPSMGGRELATRLTALRGDLKVMFISGYTGSAIAEPCAPGTAFLQKPFTPADLGRAVRDVLDAVQA